MNSEQAIQLNTAIDALRTIEAEAFEAGKKQIAKRALKAIDAITVVLETC